jgi:hypothetical protein
MPASRQTVDALIAFLPQFSDGTGDFVRGGGDLATISCSKDARKGAVGSFHTMLPHQFLVVSHAQDHDDRLAGPFHEDMLTLVGDISHDLPEVDAGIRGSDGLALHLPLD